MRQTEPRAWRPLGSPEPYRAGVPPTEPRLTRALGCTAHKGGWAKRATLGATGFPLADFKHSLTLFSKFFASFPHGTCSLSVMSQYLALDGIYHPLRAAFPNNSTLRKHFTWNWASHRTGFSPSVTSCSKEHRQEPKPKLPSSNYNSNTESARFQI